MADGRKIVAGLIDLFLGHGIGSEAALPRRFAFFLLLQRLIVTHVRLRQRFLIPRLIDDQQQIAFFTG